MNNFAMITVVFAASAAAQVKTEVPPVVNGAKPVAVEHIKVQGTALEGNLENDAVDRDVSAAQLQRGAHTTPGLANR